MSSQRDSRSRSLLRMVSPSSPPGGDWLYSDEPKPCECGNRNLDVTETVPSMMREPRRVAIRCPQCGAIWQDTCHGATHTARRWNWYGDQRHEANDLKLSDSGVRRGTCMVGGKVAVEAGAVTCGAVR